MKTTLAEWDARCAPFTIKIDAVVYLLEDGETREEINTLLLGGNGFLKSRQPSGPPRPLRTACPQPPALAPSHVSLVAAAACSGCERGLPVIR